MPNIDNRFNPAYSTIQKIRLKSSVLGEDTVLIINELNTENNKVCRFERIEMVENINDLCPSGVILVSDLADVVSYIANNKLDTIEIDLFDGGANKTWLFDITSISYSNNAVSVGDDTLVSIHFTNKWYKKLSTESLNNLLGFYSPQVFKVNEFIDEVKTTVFGVTNLDDYPGYGDTASNYFLYKPFNPYEEGEEHVSDDTFQILNYVAANAVDGDGNPNFFFWTGLDGIVNFKSFKRYFDEEPSFNTIDDDFRRIGVFEGDSVIQALSDGKFYRKAYFLATNPGLQWISKNYYYIRKTPKYLDELIGYSGGSVVKLTGTIAENQAIKNLGFHFQDEGQKYNIDVISINGRDGLTGAPKGGQALVPQNWGYYERYHPANHKSQTTLLSNQIGVDANYKQMVLMGLSGFMPFSDSPDMWKNMFDLTPIHPNYPNESEAEGQIVGNNTNLQKVIRVRRKTFDNVGTVGASADNLELIRNIELQNFVLYSLCCMGKKEDCFFAALTRYEEDNSITQDQTTANIPKKYRYKWNKLQFGGATGSSGYCACGNSGASGTTGAHIVENWCLDPYIRSGETQDSSWAINLNERGLTASQSLQYLPPGWLPVSTTSSFYYRPIGAKQSPPAKGLSGENIYHIVRMCRERVDANNLVTYFWAENVLDGTCSQVQGG